MTAIDPNELLAQYEAIIKAFDGFIYICSADYEIEFMNERFIKRTGYNPIGDKCYKALHNLDNICPWCVNERVFKGEIVRWEIKSPKDNRWYSIVNTPIHRKDGRVSKMSMIMDITSYKEALEESIKSKRFLSNVFSSIQDGISILNKDLTIIHVNPTMERWYHFNQPLIGKKCYEAYHGRNEPCTICPSLKTLKTGESAFEIVPLTGPNREVLGWLDLFSFPLFDMESGYLEGVIEYVRDITERRRAEEKIESLNRQLEARTRQLEALNKELESFNYSVSHDLKSPLINIEAIIKRFLKRYGSGIEKEAKGYIERIPKIIKYMHEIIDDLMNLSYATRKDISKDNINLSQLVKDISKVFHDRFSNRSVEFNIVEDICAIGDEGLLKIAIVNLMSNAWKFTKMNTHTKIEFGETLLGNERVFYFKDNGIGFDVSANQKIFEPFVRFHSKEEFEGTGIGLATVYRIITRHGGRIWAQSEPGKGACFYFTLPEI
ncbi:MAG TPA: PAS domain-containing sensor histidine kinase [Syntrophorhabdaceae bacterium]|nr:PAS domain-containing sensor histidine kinase [Syntrophorhabdaceae bacterium]